MKTKTAALLFSLVLSFGLLIQQSNAAVPSGLPTVPHFDNPAFSSDNQGVIIDYDHAIVLTKKDALENGGDITVIPKGRVVDICLNVPFIVVPSRVDNSIVCDFWTFQLDGNSLWDISGIHFDFIVPPLELKAGDRSKFPTNYYFIASSLDKNIESSPGETTITFTREENSLFHKKAKTLTFRFNVVEASAASSNNQDLDNRE